MFALPVFYALTALSDNNFTRDYDERATGLPYECLYPRRYLLYAIYLLSHLNSILSASTTRFVTTCAINDARHAPLSFASALLRRRLKNDLYLRYCYRGRSHVASCRRAPFIVWYVTLGRLSAPLYYSRVHY